MDDSVYITIVVEVRKSGYNHGLRGKSDLTLEICKNAISEFNFGYDTLENLLRAAKQDYFTCVEQKEAETVEE